MSHCGFEAHFLADPLHAVIACHALTLTGQPVATPGLHHDIRIEDNVITEWRNRAVSLANLDGGRVEKNRFEAPLAKSGSPPAIAVEIAASSTNVIVTDNEFSSKIRSTQRVVNTKKTK